MNLLGSRLVCIPIRNRRELPTPLPHLPLHLLPPFSLRCMLRAKMMIAGLPRSLASTMVPLLVLLALLQRTSEALRVVASAPRMGTLSGQSPPSATVRGATRWDNHLDLARCAHRQRRWPQVRELCSRVIICADDWTAVEQAHLRLALAEQNDKRVDAARRVFQVSSAE